MSSDLLIGFQQKITSNDSDIRFMALNDLIAGLSDPNVSALDDTSESKLLNYLASLIQDNNGEVQNLAVKSLGIIIRTCSEKKLEILIDQFLVLMHSKEEGVKDISSLGLKTMIMECDVSALVSKTFAQKIIPKILDQLVLENIALDMIDIVAEVFHRIGAHNQSVYLPEIQRKTSIALFNLLNHSRIAVRKRCVSALGYLSVSASDSLFEDLMEKVMAGLADVNLRKSFENLRINISALNALSRGKANHIQPFAGKIVELLLEFMEMDDDELKESCLLFFEMIILANPHIIFPHFEVIFLLCLKYITYDPNYENDDDEGEDMDNSEESESDEDDYSDDDDISWKVRRAAYKVIASIINANDTHVQKFTFCLPALIKRTNDRVEVVKIEVMESILLLIRKISIISDQSERNKVTQETQLLSKSILKESKTSSTQIKGLCFKILTVWVGIVKDVFLPFVEAFSDVISNIHRSKVSSTHHLSAATTIVQIKTLEYLKALVESISFSSLGAQVSQIVEMACFISLKKIFKVSFHGLKVLESVLCLKDIDKSIMMNICEVVLQLAEATDADAEIKNQSLILLSKLIPLQNEATDKDLHMKSLNALLARMKVEVSKFAALKAFKEVIKAMNSSNKESGNLNALLPQFVSEILNSITAANKQLRILSFEVLAEISPHLKAEDYPSLPQDLLKKIDLNDHQITAFTILVLAQMCTPKQLLEFLPTVQSKIISGSASFPSASGFVALKTFYTVLGKSVQSGSDVKALLWDVILAKNFYYEASKDALITFSKLVGSAIVSFTKDVLIIDTIESMMCDILIPTLDPKVKSIYIRIIGEVGHVWYVLHVDPMITSDFTVFAPTVWDRISGLLSRESEDIQTAASAALGSIAAGNLVHYLPMLLVVIKPSSQLLHLNLQSLKECINSEFFRKKLSLQMSDVTAVWDTLTSVLTTTYYKGNEINIVSDCLGLLIIYHPQTFIPALLKMVKSDDPKYRLCSAAIVKNAVHEMSLVHKSYDEGFIFEALDLVGDTDLEVAKEGLKMLNSLIRFTHELIERHIERILPHLLRQTVVKNELIRTVEMGPFKHKVDDGLDIRKASYDCLLSLVETMSRKGKDMGIILNECISGLSDPSQEIKALVHMILQKLTLISPFLVLSRLEHFITPLKNDIMATSKPNAVKQEIERVTELIRSAVRISLVLYQLLKNSNIPESFEEFIRTTVKSASVDVVSIENEVAQLFASISSMKKIKDDSMDLS